MKMRALIERAAGGARARATARSVLVKMMMISAVLCRKSKKFLQPPSLLYTMRYDIVNNPF